MPNNVIFSCSHVCTVCNFCHKFPSFYAFCTNVVANPVDVVGFHCDAELLISVSAPRLARFF